MSNEKGTGPGGGEIKRIGYIVICLSAILFVLLYWKHCINGAISEASHDTIFGNCSEERCPASIYLPIVVATFPDQSTELVHRPIRSSSIRIDEVTEQSEGALQPIKMASISSAFDLPLNAPYSAAEELDDAVIKLAPTYVDLTFECVESEECGALPSGAYRRASIFRRGSNLHLLYSGEINVENDDPAFWAFEAVVYERDGELHASTATFRKSYSDPSYGAQKERVIVLGGATQQGQSALILERELGRFGFSGSNEIPVQGASYYHVEHYCNTWRDSNYSEESQLFGIRLGIIGSIDDAYIQHVSENVRQFENIVFNQISTVGNHGNFGVSVDTVYYPIEGLFELSTNFGWENIEVRALLKDYSPEENYIDIYVVDGDLIEQIGYWADACLIYEERFPDLMGDNSCVLLSKLHRMTSQQRLTSGIPKALGWSVDPSDRIENGVIIKFFDQYPATGSRESFFSSNRFHLSHELSHLFCAMHSLEAPLNSGTGGGSYIHCDGLSGGGWIGVDDHTAKTVGTLMADVGTIIPLLSDDDKHCGVYDTYQGPPKVTPNDTVVEQGLIRWANSKFSAQPEIEIVPVPERATTEPAPSSTYEKPSCTRMINLVDLSDPVASFRFEVGCFGAGHSDLGGARAASEPDDCASDPEFVGQFPEELDRSRNWVVFGSADRLGRDTKLNTDLSQRRISFFRSEMNSTNTVDDHGGGDILECPLGDRFVSKFGCSESTDDCLEARSAGLFVLPN